MTSEYNRWPDKPRFYFGRAVDRSIAVTVRISWQSLTRVHHVIIALICPKSIWQLGLKFECIFGTGKSVTNAEINIYEGCRRS